MYEDEKGAEAALRMLNSTEVDGRKIYLRKVGLAGWLVAEDYYELYWGEGMLLWR